MRSIVFALVMVGVFFSSLVSAAQDEIVFATAPTHSREETNKLYTPLMQYLSKVTGKQFVIKQPANFVEYSVRMRLGKYDMLFDGPHLTGWRMVKLEHTPTVRFPGTIRIVVIAREDSAIKSMDELDDGRSRVCAFTSPNMLTMAFLSYFPNPVRQPSLIRNQGFNDLLSCLKSGRGEVAVLRDTLWEKMSEEQKAGLRVLAAPKKGYPERTFTVSAKIDEALRKQIAEALLSEEGRQVSQPILAKFKKEKFIKADPQEYQGLDLLLRPVWGFHTQ